MLETDIVSHEFGHAWAYNTNGAIYKDWASGYRENWAIYYCNLNFRSYRNRSYERFEDIAWWGIGQKGHNP